MSAEIRWRALRADPPQTGTMFEPYLPSPIPDSWLKVRVLPTEMLSLEDVPGCYDDWLASRERSQSLPTCDRSNEAEPDDGPRCVDFDEETGRLRFVTRSGPPAPLEEFFRDLHEFTQWNGECPLLSWRPGDELWRFSSEPETWQHLAGRAGFVWLRAGKPHRVFCTIMN
jgi:hypothetical protein